MNLKELCRGCRTYRRFEQKPVPKEVLADMLENVRVASCGANAQKLEYLVVRSADLVRKMQPLVKWAAYLPREIGSPRPGEEPTAFIVIVKKAGAGAFIDVDAGIAANTLAMTAWEQGVGSCIMAAIDRPAIAGLLKVPEEDTVFLALALGYPAHRSVIVPVKEDGSIRYYVDEDRDYYVPKKKMQDIVRIL